ncbi:MAG TPA: MotA/TolQ/ExbB proton channel family protein, partial [Kiritimatiellia bacterium]|nr:MotA/TolQ/ExbB proton channel family protein [Kiritimatiellia bacterium]
DVGRVGSWMSSEAFRDNAMSDLTYTLARTMMWAIPILGFIGTVQGLSSAVGGFGDFLSGAADLAAIKGAIADVTIGLGVAFDTTFLALMLVTIIQFPLSSVMRREATLLGEIEVYIDEHFVSRLPSAEQQAVVIENLEDSIEAAFRRYIPDPDRYEEVFTESIEKAGTVVEKQFESFTQKYVDARKQATDDEVQALAGALESAHLKAAELANQYARSADGIQSALGDSLAKAAQAAGDVAKQVDTIADLGAKIQELLQVEQALERAVAGIAGADEFQKTFAQLREHLATTDEFCRRLSKPRVITLHEEVVT